MRVGVEKSLKKEIWYPYGIHVRDAKGIRHNTRSDRTASGTYSSPRFSGGIYHLRSHDEVIDPAKTFNRGNLVVDIRLRDKKFSICTAPSFLNSRSNEVAQFLNGKFHLLLTRAPKPVKPSAQIRVSLVFMPMEIPCILCDTRLILRPNDICPGNAETRHFMWITPVIDKYLLKLRIDLACAMRRLSAKERLPQEIVSEWIPDLSHASRTH